MTRRRQKNYKEISLKELDEEILELTKKLNLPWYRYPFLLEIKYYEK